MDDEKLKDIGASFDDATDEDIVALMKNSKQFAKLLDQRVSRAIETYAANHPSDDGEEKDDGQAQANAERAATLDRKERIFNLAIERDIDPKTALSLLGLDDADDAERLDSLEAIRQSERDRILKANGRTFNDVKLRSAGELTLEEISRMPDHVQENLAPEITDKALSNYIESKKGSGTLRAALTGAFGGRS